MIQESIAAKRKSREKTPVNRTIHPQEQHPPQHPVISFIISADTPFFEEKKQNLSVYNKSIYGALQVPFFFKLRNFPADVYYWMKLID